MTEQELADFYQAHKDDPDLWGEMEKPRRRPRGRPSRGLSAIITVRFTPEEAAIIRREAQASGATYSDIVRNAIRARALTASIESTTNAAAGKSKRTKV
jgi:hypothetical protein